MLMEALGEGIPSALYTAAQRGHCFLRLPPCPSRCRSLPPEDSRQGQEQPLPPPTRPAAPLPATMPSSGHRRTPSRGITTP